VIKFGHGLNYLDNVPFYNILDTSMYHDVISYLLVIPTSTVHLLNIFINISIFGRHIGISSNNPISVPPPNPMASCCCDRSHLPQGAIGFAGDGSLKLCSKKYDDLDQKHAEKNDDFTCKVVVK